MVADASPPSDDRAVLAAALGSYELGPELGRGTWGVVIRGRHRALDRPVAIKVLPTAFGADASVRERFVAEARVVAGMDHPHIVAVHDFVDDGTTCAIVMELLAGGTVWERATLDGLTAEVACALVLGLCAGLHHAHGLGVTHRDVKPENLLVAASGAPKLGDFGIARLVGASAAARTATGIVLGTPAYLAPEQATGAPVGPATDVHGAGVALYELLSGRLPYGEADSPVTQIRRVAHEAPDELGVVAPWVPAPIVAVTMRALSKDPADRPPSAEALGVDLARAAALAFGRGWLAATGVPVLGAPAILPRPPRAPTARPVPPVGWCGPRWATPEAPARAPTTTSCSTAPPWCSPRPPTPSTSTRPRCAPRRRGTGPTASWWAAPTTWSGTAWPPRPRRRGCRPCGSRRPRSTTSRPSRTAPSPPSPTPTPEPVAGES